MLCMTMKVFLFLGGFVSLCVGLDSSLKDVLCTCRADHPQQKFCNADFAFVGTVMSSEELSEVEAFIYQVTISDNQIYKGVSYIGVGVTEVTVYTPHGTRFCGIPNLLYKEEYLFTGIFFEGNLVITLCNWVPVWDDVTYHQRSFLETKEYWDHCNLCEIHGVKGALETDQKHLNDLAYPDLVSQSGLWTPVGCYFNPVQSILYVGKDCESAHTYCYPVKDERCDWKLTPEYAECFAGRENTWLIKNSAAALNQFTSLKDCKKLATKWMKKKCVKIVKQLIKNRKEELEPQVLLEELIDLRDLWLEDDDEDDLLIE